MAEETNEETTAGAPEPQPKVFLVKSAVRGRTNRIERKMQPGRQRFVQRLAGGQIIVRRARPARITEAVLNQHLDVIKQAVAEHRVVVTNLAGQLVDLETMELLPPAVKKPLPNPPLDSAKNDKNRGVGYAVPATPYGTNEEPELLKGGVIPEGKEAPSQPPPPLEENAEETTSGTPTSSGSQEEGQSSSADEQEESPPGGDSSDEVAPKGEESSSEPSSESSSQGVRRGKKRGKKGGSS